MGGQDPTHTNIWHLQACSVRKEKGSTLKSLKISVPCSPSDSEESTAGMVPIRKGCSSAKFLSGRGTRAENSESKRPGRAPRRRGGEEPAATGFRQPTGEKWKRFHFSETSSRPPTRRSPKTTGHDGSTSLGTGTSSANRATFCFFRGFSLIYLHSRLLRS